MIIFTFGQVLRREQHYTLVNNSILLQRLQAIYQQELACEQGDGVEMLKRGWGQRLKETDLDVA